MYFILTPVVEVLACREGGSQAWPQTREGLLPLSLESDLAIRLLEYQTVTLSDCYAVRLLECQTLRLLDS